MTESLRVFKLSNGESIIGSILGDDDIMDFKNKEYIIDVSGALEDSSGKKSINKIDQFLIEVNKA